MKTTFKPSGSLNVILSVFGALASYLISLLFIEKFSLDEYGVYSLFISYVTLLSLVLSFGTSDLILRDSYIDIKNKRKNISEILLFLSIVFVIFSSLTFPFRNYISNIFGEGNDYYLLFLVYIMFMLLKKVVSSYLVSVDKSYLNYFLDSVLFKIEFILLIFIFVFFGRNFIEILFFKTALEFLLYTFLLIKSNVFNEFNFRFNYLKKTNLIYSAYLMLHQLTEQGIFFIDKLLIGGYLLMKDVGGYNFTLSLSSVMMIIPASIRSNVISTFSKLIKEKDISGLEGIYKGTQKVMVYITLPIVMTLTLYAEDILLVLNDELQAYSKPLVFLTLCSFSNLFFGFNGTIINMSSYYKFQFYSKIIFIIIIIVTDIFLIQKYGVNGAAIATFACFTLYNLIKTLLVFWKEKIHPFSRDLIHQFFAVALIMLLTYCIKRSFEVTLFVIISQGVVQYLIVAGLVRRASWKDISKYMLGR